MGDHTGMTSAVTCSATEPAIAWHTGAVALGVGDQPAHVGLGRRRRDDRVQGGVGEVVVGALVPVQLRRHRRLDLGQLDARARAMPVSVEVKQLASAAENSSSGFDSPPGPPSSACVAVATESAPDAALDAPAQPLPAECGRGLQRFHASSLAARRPVTPW